MKHSFLLVTLLMFMIGCSASSCEKSDKTTSPNPIDKNDNMGSNKIKITVGTKTFTVTLSDNNSAKAFKAMLPVTLNMSELNGNEKFYDFSNSLPSNASNPGIIQNGDIMLYGSRTLVLFYKTFSTSYSYTRIGKVDDTSGLAEALGQANITVVFEGG